MFLIPKRIYLNIIKNIEDPNQLKRVEDLNAETNYLEKALRFHQLKSFKSQPREENKQSPPLGREIDDSYSTVDDNKMQTEDFPQEIFDEQIETIADRPPPILSRQRTSSISAPPVYEQQNIISPVDEIPQLQQQGTREAISSQTEKDRAKFLINRAIEDILNSSSLKCPFCKRSADFKKSRIFCQTR